MQTTSATAGETAAASRELIRAVADLVSLVEPRLLGLWKSTGMTFAQRRVLRQLRDGARSPGAVAESLGIAAPTLTRQLARLERQGLIERSIDAGDRRRVIVALTAAGRRALADHRVFAGTALAAAAGELDAAERELLVVALGGLVRAARVKELAAGG